MVPKYSVHSLLVNIPPAIRSSTQTGNLKVIMIIRIKQIVIPVGQMSRQMLKSENKLIPKSKGRKLDYGHSSMHPLHKQR